MRTVSEVFKNEWNNQNRTLKYYADLTLENGSVLHLTDSELVSPGGFVIEEYVPEKEKLDICPLVSGKLTLLIKNTNDTFSGYDLEGASAVAYVGLTLADRSVEKVRMGTYHVEKASVSGDVIRLECPDNIRLLDRSYEKSSLVYPASLKTIVEDIGKVCGIKIQTAGLEHGEYMVSERPWDETLTFRDMISWAAQIYGKYVRCDASGGLYFGWYGESQGLDAYVLSDEQENPLTTEDSQGIMIFSQAGQESIFLDGGMMDARSPYRTGKSMDGGSFTSWTGGSTYDAGTFDSMDHFHHISVSSSLSIDTDCVHVTGIRVVTEDIYGNRKTILRGNEGYVFEVVKNGLIQTEDQADQVSEILWNQVKNMEFRPFTASHQSDPAVQAGDLAYVTDKKENTYKTILTNTIFTSGKEQISSCQADTSEEYKAAYYTAAEQAVTEAKKSAQKQVEVYDMSVQALTDLMAQALGISKTKEKGTDGSYIYYLRKDKQPKGSNVIWKIDKEGFFASKDGGVTWHPAIDEAGNPAPDLLTMFGIRTDGMQTNKLMSSYDASTNIELDGANSVVRMNAGGFKMGESSGKSGWARFSDGSYLEFKNGILVGGKTANGTIF